MLAEKTNLPITRMVRPLEVSRPGYHAFIGRVLSPVAVTVKRIGLIGICPKK